MHALRSGQGTEDFDSSKIVTCSARGAAWKPNVLGRIGLWRVYGHGKHGDTHPPTPPKSSAESCQFLPRLFSKPDASRCFPHVARVSPLHKLLACVLKPHLSPG